MLCVVCRIFQVIIFYFGLTKSVSRVAEHLWISLKGADLVGCCFALCRLDGLLIHSFIIIIWWLAEGITSFFFVEMMVLVFLISKRDFFLLYLYEMSMRVWLVFVCFMISLSSNHFPESFRMKNGLLRFWLISCGWMFYDKFISSQPFQRKLKVRNVPRKQSSFEEPSSTTNA